MLHSNPESAKRPKELVLYRGTGKAAPESSKKHGDCICTAAITEES